MQYVVKYSERRIHIIVQNCDTKGTQTTEVNRVKNLKWWKSQTKQASELWHIIKLLQPTGHVMHHQFNIQQLYHSAQTVFMCFVFIWEQTATCATYSINWLVFITQMKSVYSAVRTGSLNKAYWSRDAPAVQHSTTVRSAHTVFMCFVFIWEQTATCATYSINWLVFITDGLGL